MKSFEHGTSGMHNRKYEDYDRGYPRKNSSSLGPGGRGSGRGHNQYADSQSSRNTEDHAREINSAATTDNDNQWSHHSSSRQAPSRLSKYGSSITLLQPAANPQQVAPSRSKPLKKAASKDRKAQQHASGNDDLELKKLRPQESHLATQKVVTHGDLRKIKPGILSKPPSRPDGSLSGCSRQAEGSGLQLAAKSMTKGDLPRSGSRASQRKGRQASESPRGYPIGSENLINYKLMEKVPVDKMDDEELLCLQEAVKNLEACLPTQPADDSQQSASAEKPAAVPLVSQKQMVESLEQVLERRNLKVGGKGRQNALYRQCLKIHRNYLLRAEALRPQLGLHGPSASAKLPQQVQSELLMDTLDEQVLTKVRHQRQAKANYSRSVLRKGFIALLTHMMEKVAASSQIEEERLGQLNEDPARRTPSETAGALGTVTPLSSQIPTSMRANATFGGQRSILQQPSRSTFEITEDFPAECALNEQQSVPDNELAHQKSFHQNLDLLHHLNDPDPEDSRTNEARTARVDDEVSARDGDHHSRDEAEEEDHAKEVEVQRQLKSILKSPQSRLLNSRQQKYANTTSWDDRELPVEQARAAERAEIKEKEARENAKGPRESPERKAARQVEKENSPVREFLNQDESEEEQDENASPAKTRYAGAGRKEGFRLDKVACRNRRTEEEEGVSALSEQSQPLGVPDIVLSTSMFDKKDFDGKAKSQQRFDKHLLNKRSKQAIKAAVADSIQHVEEQQESLNKDLQAIQDLTPEAIMETQGNYKLLLRCMRIWKIYTKQEVYRREQARLLGVERARMMQQRLDSELELSREISGILDECAIALNHYNNHLMLSSFHGLLQNLAERQQLRASGSSLARQHFRRRLLRSAFLAWTQAVEGIQAERALINEARTSRSRAVLNALRAQVLASRKSREIKLRRMLEDRKQLVLRRVCQALLDNVGEAQATAERAEKHGGRRRLLLSLTFRALLGLNPSDRARHVEALLSAQASKQAKIMKKWQTIAQENRRMRSCFLRAHATHRSRTKARALVAWCELLQEVERGELLLFRLRAKKVFRGIKKQIASKERKQQLHVACIRHIETLRMKIVMSRWKGYVHEIQQYRNFQLQVFTKFDLFKQRQIFKQWFNQVDILKRSRNLTENTHVWYIRRMRKRVFRAWRREIRLRVTYFTIEDNRNYRLGVTAFKALQQWTKMQRTYRQVHNVQSDRVGKQVLRHWYSLLNEKLRLRLRMQKKRDHFILQECFEELREYAYRRQDFKAGMKQLLKLRARNLLRVAFVQGLKQSWHQGIIDRSLLKAAELFRRVKQQERGLVALRLNIGWQRRAGAVKARHERLLTHTFLKAWLLQYMKTDAVNRYSKRRDSATIGRTFRALRARAAYQKSLSRRLLYFHKVHESYVAKQAYQIISRYSKDRRQRRAYQDELTERFYRSGLKRTALDEIQRYYKKRAGKKAKKALYSAKGALLIKRKVYKVLAYRHQLKIREKYVRTLTQNRLRRHCLGALIYNQTLKVAERLVAAKTLTRRKARIFDGLARYRTYKKYFGVQECLMSQGHVMKIKSRIFTVLARKAARSKEARQAAAALVLLRTSRRFHAWHEEYRERADFRIPRQLALHFFAKTIFTKMREVCFQNRDTDERKRRQQLRKLQIAFFTQNSKRRALRRFIEYKTESQLAKIREDFVRTVRLRRLFGAWAGALDALRRSRILEDSADLLWRNILMERSIRALRERAERKIKDRLIVDRFQERAEMAQKADILLALHRNIAISRRSKQEFYKKMLFLAERRVADPFLKWMEVVFERRLEDRADKFFRRRKAQFLFRLSWDSLRVYTLHAKQKRTQYSAIDLWHGKMLLQRATLALKLHAHENRRLNNVSKMIKLQSGQAQLGGLFQAFTEGILLSKVHGERKRRAQQFLKSNLQRKTLIALQVGKQHSAKSKMTRERRRQNLKRDCLLQWYKGLIFKRRLQALTDIFQRENDCRLAYSFFPNLVKQTYALQIIDHLSERRVQNYQIEFLNILRRRLLMKKILHSFRMRSEMEMKRAILVELKISAYRKLDHKEQVEAHLAHVENEQETDVLQIAFNCLKEHVVLRKFKRISMRCHKLKVLRKYFCALQEHELRQKLGRKKVEEVRKIQEAKYFWHWHKAFIKLREQKQAKDFMQSTFLYQMLTAWRTHTAKVKRSRSFFANVVQRNQTQSVFHEWIIWAKTEQRNRECGKYLALLHRQNVEKKYMLIWLSQLSKGRVEVQMGNFAEVKALRRVFEAWRAVMERKNERRVQMYRIRTRLGERPELGKPLKALKNFLMFKAFNKLVEGAQASRVEEYKEENAQFAYFMQLSKKAFLGLKLAAQLQIQEDQTCEIGELNLKKRYLDLMRVGTAYLKERRKMRHKASIFRFLALQRRALRALRRHQTQVAEHRVKNEFALRLFYKRVLDKAFSSLKIYQRQKQAARAERERRRAEASHCGSGEIPSDLLGLESKQPGGGQGTSEGGALGSEGKVFSHSYQDQRHSATSPGTVAHDAYHQPSGLDNSYVEIMNQRQDYDDEMPGDLSRQAPNSERLLSYMQHEAIMTDDEWHQQRYLQHRQAAMEEEGMEANRLMAAAGYPSMGAINHVQGAEGYNIFQNLSGTASALASQQPSAKRAPATMAGQRTTEPDGNQPDEVGANKMNREGSHASQIPRNESGHQSATQLTRSAGRSMNSSKRHSPEVQEPRGIDSPHLLANSQSQFFQRHLGQSGDKDADSLQSPPKDQPSAPLVMKIDDLLRESRRTDFTLLPAEQTSNFQMNSATYKHNYANRQPSDHDQEDQY